MFSHSSENSDRVEKHVSIDFLTFASFCLISQTCKSDVHSSFSSRYKDCETPPGLDLFDPNTAQAPVRKSEYGVLVMAWTDVNVPVSRS